MVRRTAWVAILAGLVTAALHFSGCGRSGPKAQVTNVILIVIDTLRSDHLGCYGYSEIRTPVMDDLARNGTLFEQGITPVPVTVPAFTSLLTSSFPPTHGVRDNGLYALNDEMLTLAEVLRDRGLRTAAILGSAVMDPSSGLDQGFDTYDDDFEGSYRPNDPVYVPLAEELRRSRRRADIVTRNAARWIGANKDHPFFILLHYFDPHSYYDPPPPFDSLYADCLYDGEVAFTDHQIGVFFDRIRSFNIPGRTLVILTADHGEGLGEHNEAQHGLLIYDSTLRVPLVFFCPDVCPPGVRVSGAVSLVDIAPTVLQLLGVECPEPFQGVDLSACFCDGNVPARPLYCETYRPRLSYGWSELLGIRTENWKYIRAPEPELYDLAQDGGEVVNLAGSGHGKEKELAEALEDFLRSLPVDDRFLPAEIPRDDITRERLESLGYMAGMSDAAPERDGPLPDPKYEMEAFNRRQVAKFQARLGKNLLTAGDLTKGIEAYESALETDPENPLWYTILAGAYLSVRDFQKAHETLQRVLEIHPDHADAHVGLAVLYMQRGDTDAAIRAFRRSLELDPSDEEVLVRLSRLEFQRNRPQEMIPLLEEMLAAAPDNTTALGIYAEALRLTGNDRRAVRALERLSNLRPLDPTPRLFLAHAWSRLNATEEAMRWYKRALELDPELGEAYYNLACLANLENRRDEAVEWLALAVEHGFEDFGRLQGDARLNGLHDDPRVRSLYRSERSEHR